MELLEPALRDYQLIRNFTFLDQFFYTDCKTSLKAFIFMSYNNINKLAQSERKLAFICKQRFTKLNLGKHTVYTVI